MDLIKAIEEGQKRAYTTQFGVGDTVKVFFQDYRGKNRAYSGVRRRCDLYEECRRAKDIHRP